MINSITIVGNLGADPELRQTAGGPVCNLRVATTEKWSDRDGAKKERTEWHSVTVWGNQGEACARYLSKGRQVYVQGRLQSREYEKDGVTIRAWDIIASKVQFLGGGQGGGDGAARPAQSKAAASWGTAAKPAAAPASDWGKSKDPADPIPF